METAVVFEKKFVDLTNELRKFLENIKIEFDDFDSKNIFLKDRISFIKKNKLKIYKTLDFLFEKIWHEALQLPNEAYEIHRCFYVESLMPYLGDNIETNTHIRSKPLGYGGDFITMNYIYDYNSENYLGDSSYSMLINKYTCTINVACSNIARKNYLKSRILNNIEENNNVAKILSVGSGPARELIELLSEDLVKSSLEFHCLDFEQKAIDLVKSNLSRIQYDSRNIQIKFIKTDLISLVKKKSFKKELFDFIYISGVFDYLSQRLCTSLTKELFYLLGKDKHLLIANMSLERAKHRAYYEMFGEWIMVHRTKDDMIQWLKFIQHDCNFHMEDVHDCESYNFIDIQRK